MKKIGLTAGFILASALFIGCGGGGGGGGGSSSAPTVQTYSASVGVTVSSPLVNQVSAQGLRSLQAAQQQEFVVEVLSTDKSGNLIDKKTTIATFGRPIAVNVKLSPSGGTITVSAEAQGFNKASKSIRYENPSEVKSPVIELTPVPVAVQTIDITQGITIQSNGKKYVRFAFFKDNKGITRMAVGEQGIRALSQSNQKLLDVSIPLEKLQQDTQTLRVEYRDFRPSDPEDYRNFPAENTVDGQKLMSFGFDYLEITDQSGNSPFQTSQGLSAKLVDGEYYRLLRYVDCAQINDMKNAGILVDEDPSKPGIQFTFWAFDSSLGAWVEAGQGVFVNNYLNTYTDTVWDYIVQNGCVDKPPCDTNDPQNTACVDIDNDGQYEDLSCETHGIFTDVASICSDNSDYVVVSVTNPDLAWKNLDYIVPGNGQVCCSVKVVDGNGNPVPNVYLYVEPEQNSTIEWTQGYTDANGQVELCTLNWGDTPTGTLRGYNPFTFDYVSQTIDFSQQNCSIEVELINPNACTVEGKVVYDTSDPVENAYVVVHDSSYFVYRWGYTDENGNFSISVPCNTDLSVDVNTSTNVASFNVNNEIVQPEQSDDGATVVLDDIILQNNPPEGYIYPSVYTVNAGSSVTITVCAWDWDGDYPISYQVSDGTNNIATGSIESTEWCEDVTYTAPNTSGTVTLTATFTDSAQKGSTDSTTITVRDPNTDTPPVVYLYGAVEYDGSQYTYYIYGYYYDEDGDDLTATITNDCQATESSRYDGAGYVEAVYTSTNDSCTFTLGVNDGQATTAESITLTYQNLTPVVYLWAEPSASVPAGTQSVTVYSYIYDDDTNLTCQWSVNGNPVQDATDCNMFTLDLSNAQPGDVFNVDLSVTDPANNTATASIRIYYDVGADLDVIIQSK